MTPGHGLGSPGVVAGMPASSLLLRTCFLAASTAVHVGACAAAGPGPNSRPAERPRVADILVDEIVPPNDEPAADPGAAVVKRSVVGAAPARMHAHPPALRSASPPRFAMVVGSAPAASDEHASAHTAVSAPPGVDEGPVSENDVSSPAHPMGPIAPVYPAEARAQGVEADVVLAIVVTAAGTVSQASVEKRAGFGFDEAVLAAVHAARFTAA